MKKHLKAKGGLSHEQATHAAAAFDSGVAQGKNAERLFVLMIDELSQIDYGEVALCRVRCQLEHEAKLKQQGAEIREAKAGLMDSFIERRLQTLNKEKIDKTEYNPLKTWEREFAGRSAADIMRDKFKMTKLEYSLDGQMVNKTGKRIIDDRGRAFHFYEASASVSSKKPVKLSLEVRY